IAAEFVEEDADIVAGAGIAGIEFVRPPAVGEAGLALPEAAKTYRAKLQRRGVVRLRCLALIEQRQRIRQTVQFDQQFGELKVRDSAAGSAKGFEAIERGEPV